MNGEKGPGANNLNMVLGILAIIAGVVFVVLAYKILLSILFFIFGISLIYYGLNALKLSQVTVYIDMVVERIKRIFSSHQ